MKISGTFNVKLEPLDTYNKGQDEIKLGRMSIDKVFHGDLKAESKGEMLSAMMPVRGSAGYVAMEQVSGRLSGKKGSFILMHYGVMEGGVNHLTLEVVPDSGTNELKGLRGKMNIEIKDSKHFYEFNYEL